MGDTITVASGQTLSQIASKYGVSVDALMNENNIKDANSIKAGQKITIPIGQPAQSSEKTVEKDDLNYERQKLHYMDLKISDKYGELAKAKTPEEKAEIQKEINELKAKQAKQKETAKMELDPNQDYILITPKKDINVEELKKLFDIKDGAVRAHNDLDYEYTYYEGDVPSELEGRQYKDYSNNTIQAGRTIKVKPSEIDNQGALKELWNWATN